MTLALILAVAQLAAAQTESIIYSFANPPDAYGPRCNLVVDATGNMYGTTFSGGMHNLGAVFMVSPAGVETVVYSFAGGADGSHPIAGLARNAKTGNLYGTTIYGGATGNGTVFELTPAGVESVLYSFKGGIDGANPYSSVLRLGTTIYGTTINGGAFGYGTVFKLTATGKETILHSFNSAFPTLDGSYPYAGLVSYKGLLYGTTTLGGASNLGTVFSVTTNGAEALVYSFKGGSNDGQGPNAGLVFDRSGNLYGTTYSGGTDNAGTVFAISAGSESVLHNFHRNSSDGTNPYSNLILYKGNFYGTTLQGGGTANGGTVFEITPGGAETVLHSFTGGADGFNPYSALVVNAANTFYSTALQGGTSNLGTVFKLVR
ncbi:MAG TPA: choice-of-anchor tandem repeat GloVer-containing protein [Terriglobales bacterium]|nr:choice-of-anchor tandem repeat GloVer-containing protein [Terriglobales bacterium]